MTSLAFLLFSCAYVAAGWKYSVIEPGGDLGAGFSPRIIGVPLVAACLYNFLRELRRAQEPGVPGVNTELFVFLGFFICFWLILYAIGTIPATFLFMFCTLSYLERTTIAKNLSISVFVTGLLYAIFYALASPLP